MKAFILSMPILFLTVAGALAQNGGGYELKNSGFTSGSGSATNGAYRLTGAFQPSASGAATNGGYALTGSFATVGVVQTPGAPFLKITGSGAGVVLSWPDPSTGFKLQSTPTVADPASWTDVTQPVVVMGGDKTVTVPAAGQYRFYRLFKP